MTVSTNDASPEKATVLSAEDFVRTWNSVANLAEFEKLTGMNPAAAKQRATGYRKRYKLNLKAMGGRGRKKLDIEKLASIANAALNTSG